MNPSAPHFPVDRRAEARERPLAAALDLPPAHVGLIERSHDRCRAQGLVRIEQPDFAPLGGSDLALLRERHRRLHAHAAPVMEMLSEQIAGTESMVVLTDAAGTIIHATGDDDFLSRASKVALAPGVNWSEPARGTNAIGTALVDELPTLVHADEHYLHANHFLTCSATPILDPRGSLLGVLDVTGDHRSYHRHTMALVQMSARMIENHWLSEDFRDAMRLHFHRRADFIGTLMEGLLAVSADGRIVGANRSALELLGLSGAALRALGLEALFGTPVGALVDHFRSPMSAPLRVVAPGGQRFHLHARFDWPVWRQMLGPQGMPGRSPRDAARAAPAPPPAIPPSAPASRALARLDTGDARMAAVIDRLRRVGDHRIALLLQGETGTGKLRLAQALHADSLRAGQPCLVLRCATATLPADLPAAGGTLVLDEVADLPLAQQDALLQQLQSGAATAPGAAAVVCTTRHDLRTAVAAGRFREELYFRLNGLALRLPALRERSDLAVLVRRLLDERFQAPDLAPSPEVWRLFERCAWPGNLRQLINVLHGAVVLAGRTGTIGIDHLPEDFLEQAAEVGEAAVMAAAEPTVATLQDLELDAIRRAVAECGGNISRASRRLGVSRNTLYRKLRASGGA